MESGRMLLNNKRRTRLRSIEEDLGRVLNLLNSIYDEEQDCMDNVPENLQDSERYSDMEACVEALSDAVYNLEEAIDSIKEAIDK